MEQRFEKNVPASQAGPASRGWLWSFREDMLILTLPVLLAAPLLIFGRHAYPSAWLVFFIFIIVNVAIDFGHVFSTFFRTYADERFYRRRPLLYFGLPLALFALLSMTSFFSAQATLMILAYANIFHTTRQQVGMARLSNWKFGPVSKRTLLIDDVAFHTIGFSSFLWLLTQLPPNIVIRFQTADSYILPRQFAPYLAAAFIVTALAYTARQIFIFVFRRGEFNPGKFNLWVVSLIMFGSAFILWPLIIFFSVMGHSLPYTALVWREGRRRWLDDTGWRKRLFGGWAGLSIFIFCLGIFAWIWLGIFQGLLPSESDGSLFPRINTFAHAGIDSWSPSIRALLLALLATVPLLHYLLDGFIWKASDVRLLDLQRAPET